MRLEVMLYRERMIYLNKKEEAEGKYIIYWMQASQRIHYNQALDTAIIMANDRSLPLIVYFELIDHFPDANLRHYHFMLEGLKEVSRELKKMQIRFVINCPSVKGYPDLNEL